jgi:hypothetical protein
MARGQPAGEEVYRPEVPAEDLPRKIVPEIRSLPLAEFAPEIASTLQSKYQTDSATWAGDQIARARIKAVQNLDAAKSAVPMGQDPGNFTEKFLSSFDKDMTPVSESAGANPYARIMIQKGLTELRDTLAQHTVGWEAAQRVAYRNDSVINNAKSQADVVESHPELWQSAGSTLTDQINSIGGDPAKRLALHREVDTQLSLAAGYGLSRQDPRGVIQALNDPEHAPEAYKALEGLNDAQREAVRSRANGHLADPVQAALAANDLRTAQRSLNANADLMDPKTFESSQRAILATQEHSLVMQEKYQKVASDNLSKQGDQLLSQGKLTPDWIEAHHNVLEANEVRYFYKALSGTEEAATNPKTFSDLMLRAAGGEDVRDEARTALIENHTLSRQDFSKITGIVDSTRPGWYKRGSQYIADTLKVSELEKDPAGQQSRAYALRDWYDWADQHSQATLSQANEAMDNIANHYRIVPEGKTVLMMRAPQFLIGSRTNPVDENGNPDPTLKATVRRYQEAVRSGQIRGAAAEEEALRITALRNTIQEQIAQAAKVKAKKAQ